MEGCLRAGEERPNPEMLSLVRVAVESLNFDWLLGWEAVTGERSGSCEDAPLGYSSSPGGHWLLT